MNDKDFLTDIYKDFFGKIEEQPKIDETESINIDNLFITEESKKLLNNIILYMEKYSKGEETNYINFNILIDDDNVSNEIASIIQFYAKKYNYINNNNISNLSLYKVEDADSMNNVYNSNGIIIMNDLNALNLNDTSFKMKFLYQFKENLKLKKITILSDKKENIKEFLLNDESLEKSEFIFKIETVKPEINDIYNELKEKINNENLNVDLLDYISNTYPNSTNNYSEYINDLYKYISFNKELPKIDETKSIDEVFASLNELVGLKKVKETLNDLVNLITLKNKTKDDLKINNVNLHMVFLGNPGTGKTTVARLIANILYELKYLKQNKLIEVSSKDLVAEYVGQTAVKTMNVIDKAKGGLLFIDEAYSLASKNNENSYNAECIATLIKAMEDYRDDLVVIFAGYTKEMQDFLDSNSGIVSRIGYTLEFEDYTNQELIEIFKNFVNKAGFILEDDAIIEVEKLINENRNTKNFGNARFIRNLYEKTVINHASNTKNNKSKKILKTITKKDIKY